MRLRYMCRRYLSAALLIAVTACAASVFFGRTQAKADFVSLNCTSATLAAVHVDIVEDGKALAVRDRNAQTQELYPIEAVSPEMIDRILDEYLRNGAYRCVVTRATGRPWN